VGWVVFILVEGELLEQYEKGFFLIILCFLEELGRVGYN
jgi:hypothetical protein